LTRTPSSGFRRAGLLLIAAVMALAGCGEDQQQGGRAAGGKSTGEKPAGQTDGVTQTRREAAKPRAKVPRGKGFDFYVLSLSWSPTWCAENDAFGRTRQCRRGESHGFIVHGLWPQAERGYPDFCPTREPDRVPESLGRSVIDIIPSMGLIGHQWRKHGSCSGLGQHDYFNVTRAARERVTIPPALEPRGTTERIAPDAVEQAFVAANPGLPRDAIAVTCEGGRLEEVRICMTADLAFRPCPEVDRAACRAKTVEQPPVR
jgi:ribonuclease T2